MSESIIYKIYNNPTFPPYARFDIFDLFHNIEFMNIIEDISKIDPNDGTDFPVYYITEKSLKIHFDPEYGDGLSISIFFKKSIDELIKKMLEIFLKYRIDKYGMKVILYTPDCKEMRIAL